MPFDPTTDSIAITVPQFTLLRHVDGPFQRYNEPYIVSAAIDESGSADPQIDFNYMPFPKVAGGGTVRMLGDGHLVYGPKNPGSFVAASVLVMESDKDIREFGEDLETVVRSKALDLGIKALLASNPTHTAIVGVLKELAQLIAGFLKENGDDELFRVEGSFLRDNHANPYHVNRSYRLANDFARVDLAVIPLPEHNQQGPLPKGLAL